MRGGPGRRPPSLWQRGQNSRKEEGPDGPPSQLPSRSGEPVGASLLPRGRPPALGLLRPELCAGGGTCGFSVPQEVASVIWAGVGSQGRVSWRASSQSSRAAMCSVIGVVAFIEILGFSSPNTLKKKKKKKSMGKE